MTVEIDVKSARFAKVKMAGKESDGSLRIARRRAGVRGSVLASDSVLACPSRAGGHHDSNGSDGGGGGRGGAVVGRDAGLNALSGEVGGAVALLHAVGA